MTDYFFRVADAAGLPRPPAISLEEAEERLSAGMLSYMHESRRLGNRRLVAELGVELRFPTLAEGLADILGKGRGPRAENPGLRDYDPGGGVADTLRRS